VTGPERESGAAASSGVGGGPGGSAGRSVGEAGKRGPSERSRERFSRMWLLGGLLAFVAFFLYMVRPFLTPVVLAAVFAALAYPLYLRIVGLLRGRRSAASLITIAVLFAGVLIPLYVTVNLVTLEAINLYDRGLPHLQTAIADLEASVLNWLDRADDGSGGTEMPFPAPEWLARLPMERVDWAASVQDVAGRAGNAVATIINRTSKGTLALLFNLFVVLFTMFYFFRDGERIIARLKYLSPLDSRYEDLVLNRLVSVSRATFRGSLVLGLIQASIGAVTLALTGVEAPILWGITMLVLSVVPLLGTWLVMYPIALVQLLLGNAWQALVVIAVTAVVITNIDNVLRPRLVGRGAGMHDLLIFFSTVGGIALYGVMGFIVGPIIAAMFMAMVDIYALEYRIQLGEPGGSGTG